MCEKLFVLSSTLRVHRLLHLKLYKCAECGKQFALKHLLREHMLYHTDPDQFKCANCGPRFDWKRLLRQHKVLCGRSFNCDVAECELETKTYVDIEDHYVQVHGRQRRLKCPICNACFSSRGGLSGHERRVHSGRYNNTCDKCGLGFDSRARFQKHKKNCNGVAAVRTK